MYKAVLLDLDGTITNPFIGITNGIMTAYKKLGMEVPERETLKTFIGPPLTDEFARRGFTPQQVKDGVKFYREYYGNGGLFENELVEGTEQLLKELKSRGIKVCLATCKPEAFSVRILERFGIMKYFDFIGASTFDGSRDKKSQVIQYVLDGTGLAPDECLMVGDRSFDIVGAHEVGVKCAAVLVGFGSREEFIEYNADYIAEKLIDILDIV